MPGSSSSCLIRAKVCARRSAICLTIAARLNAIPKMAAGSESKDRWVYSMLVPPSTEEHERDRDHHWNDHEPDGEDV